LYCIKNLITWRDPISAAYNIGMWYFWQDEHLTKASRNHILSFLHVSILGLHLFDLSFYNISKWITSFHGVIQYHMLKLIILTLLYDCKCIFSWIIFFVLRPTYYLGIHTHKIKRVKMFEIHSEKSNSFSIFWIKISSTIHNWQLKLVLENVIEDNTQ